MEVFRYKPFRGRLTPIITSISKLGVGFNLLGRMGIFEHFKICFDEAQGIITFETR